MEQIVLATGNKGKIREFSEAFSHLSIDCIPVKEVITIEEPEETGTTFMENALLKARYYAKATNRPCLADDSGITVDALNGAPGVYSARYAGHHGDDNANNEKLIQELQGKADRTAHYVCALALVYPDGREVTAEGYCDGLVQDDPNRSEDRKMALLQRGHRRQLRGLWGQTKWHQHKGSSRSCFFVRRRRYSGSYSFRYNI